MDPELIQQVVDALKLGDGEKALDLLEQALVAAAGGDPNSPAVAEGPTAAGADPKAPPPGQQPQAMSAAATLSAIRVMRTELKTLRAENATFKSRVDVIDKDRAEIDLTARRAAIVELVQLGHETPATAWQTREADAAKGVTALTAADRVPVPRLANEPLAELRTRVAALRGNAPAAPCGHTPPPSEVGEGPTIADEVAKLSARQIQAAKARNLTPEQFVMARRGSVRKVG